MTERRARVAAACAWALWTVPVLLGWCRLEALVIPGLSAALMLGLCAVDAPEARPRMLLLWALALTVRWLAFLLLVAAQRSEGLVLLGPDGAQYLERSVALAEAGFLLDTSPIAAYGTYDVGPYYLFAAVLTAFGSSLLSLQIAGAALGALVAPTMYATARRLLPSGATLVGFILAVYPTAAIYAVVDLWKDPAVVTWTALALWGLALLVHDPPTSRLQRAAVALVTVAALLLLHVSRFYTLLFLIVAAGLVTVAWWLAGRLTTHPALARRVGTAFAVLIAADVALLPLGWPPTALQLYDSARGVIAAADDTPRRASATSTASSRAVQSREVARPDLADSLRFARGQATRGPASGTVGADATASSRPQAGGARTLRVDTEVYEALQPPVNVRGWAAQVGRKLLGPFIWIMPPDWSTRTLLAGDYLLYPGMLFWYALWPALALGLGVIAVRAWSGTSPFMLAVLGVFVATYLVLYLGVNLAFRQREALLPFLLLVAPLGLDLVRRSRRWQLAYGLYAVGLVALAVAHLAMRARLT